MKKITLVYGKSHNAITGIYGATMFELSHKDYKNDEDRNIDIKNQVNEFFITYDKNKVVILDEVKVYEATLVDVHKEMIK